MALDPRQAGMRERQAAQEVRAPAPRLGPARHLADGDGTRMGQRAHEVGRLEAPRLVGRARLGVGPDHPVELEGRGHQRVGDGPEGAQAAELPELERVGEDARRAERQDEARERRRRRHVRRVDVRVDVTGDEDAARGVDEPGPRAHHVLARSDVRDALADDGDVGRVELARVDVEQRPAAHVEVGGRLAARDRGEPAPFREVHPRDYRRYNHPVSEAIVVAGAVRVPAHALTMRAVRASGPGGQNVNKVATKVELRVDLDAIEGLSAAARARLATLTRGRLDAEGRLFVTSQATRNQARNVEDARAKVSSLVAAALREPRARRASRPPAGARERRLESKKRRAALKRGRARMDD